MFQSEQLDRLFENASNLLSLAMIGGLLAYACWLPYFPKKAEVVGTRSAHIEVLRVRPESIDALHVRNPPSAHWRFWEPGGWIADEPIKTSESVHPRGEQKILADAVPDPREPGTYLPRGDLKLGMTEKDLSRFAPMRELRGDRR